MRTLLSKADFIEVDATFLESVDVCFVDERWHYHSMQQLAQHQDKEMYV